MGHVIQLRREGVQASAPMFIPFLGAVIWAKSLGGNALAEARVGLAGPILGTLGTAALIPVADATGNDLFRALAFTGFFLNLFNLLPVLPLDGGRAMAALSPSCGSSASPRWSRCCSSFPNPIMLLILLFGGMETWRRWRERKDAGGAGVLQGVAARPVHRRGRLRGPDRAARGGHATHPHRARPSATSKSLNGAAAA